MKRFNKGQTVYQACSHFAENETQVEMRVISRTIDACGAKQATFEDHGNDSVYGRQVSFSWANHIFGTAEEAFAYLAAYGNKYMGLDVVINPVVLSDRDALSTTIATKYTDAA